MDVDVNGQGFDEMEPDNIPEDDQLLEVVVQPLPNQLNDIVEDNTLIRNKDGTTQLIFSSLYILLHLIQVANSKMIGFSKRLKKIEEKNDMRALGHEIIGKEFYRALKTVLKRDLVLSVVHSLFKRPFASMAEFYCRALSAFMLNTSLPRRINGLLKGGIFSQADDLLPFLMVMCKAFFCQTLELNKVNGVREAPPFNFYQEVEGDEDDYFLLKKVQLKEFWIMKTEMPGFLKLLGKNVRIRNGGFYYEMMGATRVSSFSKKTRYIRTCFHIEVPEEIARDLDYSVYLRLVQEKILFVKEANQVILAPGCDFLVDDLIEIPVKKIEQKQAENGNEKIRIIKLKMVAKVGQRFHLEEEQDQEQDQDQEPRLAKEEQEAIPAEENQQEIEQQEENNEEPEFEQQAGVEEEIKTIWNIPIYDEIPAGEDFALEKIANHDEHEVVMLVNLEEGEGNQAQIPPVNLEGNGEFQAQSTYTKGLFDLDYSQEVTLSPISV